MKRKLTQAGAISRAKSSDVFSKPGKKRTQKRKEIVSSEDDDSNSSESDYSVSEVERENSAFDDALAEEESENGEKLTNAERDAQIMAARSAREEEKRNVVKYQNKQKVLVFSSRGVTSRFRHLNEDFRTLLVHSKKENKHDTKKNLYEINDLCEMNGCNNCIFFEARKSQDLYLWVTRAPNGPSAKFLVANIHTMEELRLTGNCLKGSRPILSFDKAFDSAPHMQLLKELFTTAFGTPNGHPKSKPFVDHVMNFAVADGRIWFRHFQITDSTQDKKEINRALKDGKETINLVEIGPRFVLSLVKIFNGGFGGQVLHENPRYVKPNTLRSEANKKKGNAYAQRKAAQKKREVKKSVNVVPKDPLGDVFK
uniref:Brix domain-containing protein n=1 Tax=Aplanochytrium stocchinoi TaxID=215587 RepID=A0A7S3V162_9STRA|mmetsp:Transcript_17707/g.21816  ORF Transcript_17707/g.21816 Transcript_17707/m.21816 type:complete len:369 (+) Transcript_17707:103-1209(+)